MDPRTWAQINALFHQLVDLTPADQQKELVSLRQIYDPDIIEEVEFLLQAVTELDELFLETPKYDPLPIILWIFGEED